MITHGNNIVIKQDGVPTQTKSGLFINIFGENRQNRPNSGVVECVGEDVKTLKVGDRVLFTNYSGVYFKNEADEDRIIMSETEPIMILKNGIDINSNFDINQIYK